MIVVDLQAAQSLGSGNRGIGRYTRDLVRAIVTRHPDVVDRFTYNPALPTDPRLLDIVAPDRLVPIGDLAGVPIDVFHMTSPFESVPVDHLLPAAPIGALVATCFDLIPYRFQQRYLDHRERPQYIARLTVLNTCAAVVTDSQSAADDCAELLGVPRHRLTVIGGGTNECFRLPTDTPTERMEALRESLPELREGFVFAPTGMDWRKNVEGAIATYAALPDRLQAAHQLVIGCKVTHHQRRVLAGWAHDAGCTGDVIVTGFVGDDDLVRLYQSADTVFFPSFYEGFGLPVLEARRCGARVICSDVSSLPEVMPLPDARFNPYVVDDMATLLERALTDDAFRAVLAAAPDPGFTYELAADRTVAVYSRVRAEALAVAAARRPRIAVVTLLPPSPSGVADHSAALLDELSARTDVTCFVDDDVAPLTAAQVAYPVRRLGLLEPLVRGGAFDAVLYCMGNNELHRPFLDVLARVPGYVLFHDVRLTDCYPPEQREAMAERFYPADTHPFPLYAAEVATAARGCLVHSQHAADLLAADCGVTAVDVGPMAMRVPVPPGVVAVSPTDDAEQVSIVTAGVAATVKQPHRFVAAAELLLSRHPEWSAALVGLGGERFVDDGSPVLATGRVDARTYGEFVRRATVLVQLRGESNGESSAAVADAIGNAVPLVATDLGATRELPDDVVVKVAANVSTEELAGAIESIVTDPARRAAMSAAAARFAATNSMRAEAERIVNAMFPPAPDG
ncbi:MAG TPA: glycosyltransferase [Ilumatobacter sp.]|nr:glycosyltransferase [Ilumatobacter sp.]